MIGALTSPRFAAAIPGAQLVPLFGCGHVPRADDPALFATAITELTKPNSRPGAATAADPSGALSA